MASVTLKARLREKSGKSETRRLRSVNMIPGVVYGHGEESEAIVIDLKHLYPVLHTAARENVIVDLEIEGSGNQASKAIIREIQYHPVTGKILHIDFQHISMTEEITIRVPVDVIGEPIGVKTKGGILERILREVEVECLPANIPEKIVVDVSDLDVGQSLQVKNLRVENARIVSDPESTVVTVVAPAVEVKPEVEAVAPEEVPAGEEPKEEEGEESGKKSAEK
ncbi:MAG: 50S ribosomal protein L25 [bacterium]